MHIMPQNNSARHRTHKVSMPKLRRNHNLAMQQMPKIWKTIPLPEMRLPRTINREKKQMAKVLVSMKIFPISTDIDLNQLKQKIEKTLPADSSVYKFAQEPVAFGLNALIAHILLPEEKSGGLEEIENSIQKIDGVSQIQMVMVRRV